MRKIAKLHGLPTPAQGQSTVDQALCAHGIETVEDLLACVGNDTSKGITQVSDVTGVGKDFLMTLLMVEILEGAKRSGEPNPFAFWRSLKRAWTNRRRHWTNFKTFCKERGGFTWSEAKRLWFGLKLIWLFPKRFWLHLNWLWRERQSYWPDMLLLIMPLALIALALNARSVLRTQVQQVAVKPGADLKAFRVIKQDDLAMVKGSQQEGAFDALDKVAEHYALVNIGPGETLSASQLVPEEIAQRLQDRQLLSLPVKASSLPAALGPPTVVRLLLSPRGQVDKALDQSIFEDVILLAIERQGDNASLVVALTGDALKRAQPLLGVSDVFVLHPPQGK